MECSNVNIDSCIINDSKELFIFTDVSIVSIEFDYFANLDGTLPCADL